MEDNVQRSATGQPDASNWKYREGTLSLWDVLDLAFKEALNDPSWKVRATAIQILGRLSEQLIIEPLRTALDDQDFSVRSAALHTLGTFKGCLPTEYLLSLAQEESKDWITREAAITALERAGEYALAKPLRKRLNRAFETDSYMNEEEEFLAFNPDSRGLLFVLPD